MATANAANAARPASDTYQDLDDALPAVVELFDTTNHSVCEFGDITLVVKDGYHPQLKLTVNSCILASTSKVFRALFQGCFAEGAAIRSGVREIYMNDKPAQMLALCQLLHHRPVEPAVTQWTMPDFALLVDKFDCVQALKLATDGMLGKFPASQFHDLVVSAYILDQLSHFRRFTQALVRRSPVVHPYELDSQPAYPILEHLPSDFRMSISLQQSSVLNELTQCLTTVIDNFTTVSHVDGKSNLVYRLMSALKASQLWPIGLAVSRTKSIKDQLVSLSSLDLPVICADSDMEYGDSPSPAARRRQHGNHVNVWRVDDEDHEMEIALQSASTSVRSISPSPREPVIQSVLPPTGRTLIGLADSLDKLCVGLCLDCVRRNLLQRVSSEWTMPAKQREVAIHQ